MTIQELRHILLELCKLESENEIVEFKEAKSSYDFTKLGKYFSALSKGIIVDNLFSKTMSLSMYGFPDKTSLKAERVKK